METVLVVAERARCDEIKRLFLPGGYAFIRAESEKEARMKLLDFQLSLVIVDAMLPGSASMDTAVFAASMDADTVSGSSRDSFSAVLGAISVAREKIRKAEEKNRKLLLRLKNEKLLTEAKCLLAGRRGMSEAEAHSYIEKKAMNCRISLEDAAVGIIRELS